MDTISTTTEVSAEERQILGRLLRLRTLAADDLKGGIWRFRQALVDEALSAPELDD